MKVPRTIIGTLGTTQKVLYKAPSGTYALVAAFVALNTGGTARSVDLYLNKPGVTDHLARKLQLSSGYAAGNSTTIEREWILEEGCSLEGSQTVGSDVTYTISVLEWTA